MEDVLHKFDRHDTVEQHDSVYYRVFTQLLLRTSTTLRHNRYPGCIHAIKNYRYEGVSKTLR